MALTFVGIGEKVHLEKTVVQSAPLVVGASQEDVLRVLGEPDMKWGARGGLAGFLFGERPVQWIYGTTIDLQAIVIPELPCPNPIPVKIRLFVADEDDLVIDWSRKNTVSAIKRPEIDVPDEVARLYEPVYFFTDVAGALAAKNDD